MAKHFFVNFDIFKWLYLALGLESIGSIGSISIYTKLGDFCKAWSVLYDYVEFTDSYLVLHGLKSGNDVA